MKTGTFLCVAVPLACTIFFLAQWRTISQLRNDNLQLRAEHLQQVERSRTETDRVIRLGVNHQAEANSLASQVAALKTELEEAQRELKTAEKRLEKYVGEAPATLAMSKPLDGGSQSALRGYPIKQRSQPRLRSGVLETLPELPFGPWLTWSASCRLDGIELWNGITSELVGSGPTWAIDQPLPLSFTDVERIARGQLDQLVQDAQDWPLESIKLQRSYNSDNWHYVIRLRPPDMPPHDGFSVHVSMSGQPGITGHMQRPP